MKKIQRKAKQEGDKNADKDKDKDEKSIKQESPSSEHEHGNYLGLDTSYSASSQPLNPNLPYSPDGTLFDKKKLLPIKVMKFCVLLLKECGKLLVV